MKRDKEFWQKVLVVVCWVIGLVLLQMASWALLDSFYATGLLKRPTAEQIAIQQRFMNDVLRGGLIVLAIPGIPAAVYYAGLLALDRAYTDEKRKRHSEQPAPWDDAGAAMEILMRDADGEDTKNFHGT